MTRHAAPRVRRAVAALIAGGVLAGITAVGAATPAGAHESIEHFCGSLRLPDDNGPITDLLHHAIEDPLRPLGLAPIVHGVGCRLAGLEAELGLR